MSARFPYRVHITDTTYKSYIVYAESEEDARHQVESCDGDLRSHFKERYDGADWGIEKVEPIDEDEDRLDNS